MGEWSARWNQLSCRVILSAAWAGMASAAARASRMVFIVSSVGLGCGLLALCPGRHHLLGEHHQPVKGQPEQRYQHERSENRLRLERDARRDDQRAQAELGGDELADDRAGHR